MTSTSYTKGAMGSPPFLFQAINSKKVYFCLISSHHGRFRTLNDIGITMVVPVIYNVAYHSIAPAFLYIKVVVLLLFLYV